MTKEVLIAISGLQFELDTEEAVEVISRGQYYKKNGKHYITYEEMDEGSPGQLTKSTIKISSDQVDMIRNGQSRVHMVFARGQNNLAYYNTPFGQMLMGIHTREIELYEEDKEILVKLYYSLELNYSHISDCEVAIRISSV
ncbi:MAG TPA: DUF1934 domain-containing protein [Candidatus Caccomorpha excrementavium]|nr:DUF1934 domain-containing protein [Candidatus Caccomorpha excrementavium]